MNHCPEHRANDSNANSSFPFSQNERLRERVRTIDEIKAIVIDGEISSGDDEWTSRQLMNEAVTHEPEMQGHASSRN